MPKFLCFLLLPMLICCSLSKKNIGTNANQSQVSGKVMEVIWIDTNSRILIYYPDYPICFVVETQNKSTDTLILWQPKRGEYPDDCFLNHGFYSQGEFLILPLPNYNDSVVIPPLSSQIDTIEVFQFSHSAPDMDSQMFWVNKFKNGSTSLLYLPRPAPFYQDTIFYTFGDDVKYSSRLH